MIGECFAPEYVAVVTGGEKKTLPCWSKSSTLSFYRQPKCGKQVLLHGPAFDARRAGAGRQKPLHCDSTAKLKLAAKRIVFGKYLNCGQTCVAPDYILCHRSVKDALVEEICRQVRAQYGQAPLENPDYGKIVNQKHFDCLCALLDPDKVVLGGAAKAETLQIEPTVMDSVSWDDAVMQEEILGPFCLCLRSSGLKKCMSCWLTSQSRLRCTCFRRTGRECSRLPSAAATAGMYQRHHHSPCHQRNGLWRRG